MTTLESTTVGSILELSIGSLEFVSIEAPDRIPFQTPIKIRWTTVEKGWFGVWKKSSLPLDERWDPPIWWQSKSDHNSIGSGELILGEAGTPAGINFRPGDYSVYFVVWSKLNSDGHPFFFGIRNGSLDEQLMPPLHFTIQTSDDIESRMNQAQLTNLTLTPANPTTASTGSSTPTFLAGSSARVSWSVPKDLLMKGRDYIGLYKLQEDSSEDELVWYQTVETDTGIFDTSLPGGPIPQTRVDDEALTGFILPGRFYPHMSPYFLTNGTYFWSLCVVTMEEARSQPFRSKHDRWAITDGFKVEPYARLEHISPVQLLEYMNVSFKPPLALEYSAPVSNNYIDLSHWRSALSRPGIVASKYAHSTISLAQDVTGPNILPEEVANDLQTFTIRQGMKKLDLLTKRNSSRGQLPYPKLLGEMLQRDDSLKRLPSDLVDIIYEYLYILAPFPIYITKRYGPDWPEDANAAGQQNKRCFQQLDSTLLTLLMCGWKPRQLVVWMSKAGGYIDYMHFIYAPMEERVQTQGTTQPPEKGSNSSAASSFSTSNFPTDSVSATDLPHINDSSTVYSTVMSFVRAKETAHSSGSQPSDAPPGEICPGRGVTADLKSEPFYLAGVTMRPHQMSGLNWLKSRFELGLNAILADEKGVGRTMTAIAFLAYLQGWAMDDYECFLAMNGQDAIVTASALSPSKVKVGPFLVVCPSNRLEHWASELRHFAPSLIVQSYSGTKSDRQEVQDAIHAFIHTQSNDQQKDPLLPFQVLLTTYEDIIDDNGFFSKFQFPLAIIDEAHRLNDYDQDSELFKLLMNESKVSWKLCLTSTPVQDSLNQLWRLLWCLHPEVFNNKTQFLKEFEISSNSRGLESKESQSSLAKPENTQSSTVMAQFNDILSPFLLHRLKADVLNPSQPQGSIKSQPQHIFGSWTPPIPSHIDLTNSIRHDYHLGDDAYFIHFCGNAGFTGYEGIELITNRGDEFRLGLPIDEKSCVTISAPSDTALVAFQGMRGSDHVVQFGCVFASVNPRKQLTESDLPGVGMELAMWQSKKLAAAKAKKVATPSTEATIAAAAAAGTIILEEEFAADYVPTDEEINEYAVFLGLDLTNADDRALLWIAREGLKAPLPAPWKPCKTEENEVYYFNFESGESIWEHPCDEYYKERVAKERLRQNRIGTDGSSSSSTAVTATSSATKAVSVHPATATPEETAAAIAAAHDTIVPSTYDPAYEPDQAMINEHAIFFGLDLKDPIDSQLLYLVRECLKAPLPEPWKTCRLVEDGETQEYYFNFSTGESAWEHPNDEIFKARIKVERLKLKLANSTVT